jgi:hypothetical protein
LATRTVLSSGFGTLQTPVMRGYSCGACIHVAFQRLDATESEHELAARMEFITGESQFWPLEAELPL